MHAVQRPGCPAANTQSAHAFMAERRRVRTFEWSTAVIAAISISAGIAVYVRDGTEKFLDILTNDLWLFTGMLPKMAAGCMIAAFVTRLLPREVVARVVGAESGLLGILLALTAAGRSKALCREGLWEGAHDFVILIPRVLIGVVGSGYIAAVMPQDLIVRWIGPNSGLLGITIATLVGAGTPGGAVVGFSIGAAAL